MRIFFQALSDLPSRGRHSISPDPALPCFRDQPSVSSDLCHQRTNWGERAGEVWLTSSLRTLGKQAVWIFIQYSLLRWHVHKKSSNENEWDFAGVFTDCKHQTCASLFILSDILNELFQRENRVLHYWTMRKRRLDQCQQYVVFERSAKQVSHNTGSPSCA